MTNETPKIIEKLNKARNDVYYLDDTLVNPMQTNPLGYAFAIKEEESEGNLAFYIVEWDERIPYWVFKETSYEREKAEKRVKFLNKEHNTIK